MAKFIASIKAIITRLVFASHGFIAIWQVTNFKRNPIYWYLCCPIILLFFEGIFTLTIKANQEWKWFCPSVFLYLGSVVPAIWLLELDKVDRRLRNLGSNINFNDTLDLTNLEDLKQLQKTLGVNIRLPDIQISTETWVTLIEQFLMLILIIGRWMLPKGELTRDQLSQLLLVYIGTAADIIEFFDSFKEDKVAREPMLVYLTLGIWAWSLMQFTVVLTATKSRKSRLSSGTAARKKVLTKTSCCGIDVWAIGINMVLQDGPFLAFRLILIIHYKIVSYMNIFFTCKNTLVILLQLYRLYVVQSESRSRRRRQRHKLEYDKYEIGNISVISRPDTYAVKKYAKRRKAEEIEEGVGDDDNDNDNDDYYAEKKRKMRGPGRRKDLEANVVDSEDLDTEPSDRYITLSKNKGSDHRKSRQETDRSRSSSQGRGKRSHEDRRRACEKEKQQQQQQQQQEQQRRRQKQEYRESDDLECRSSSEQRSRKKSARRVAELDRTSKKKRRHTEVDEHDGDSTSDDSQSESEERRKYHRRKQRPPNRD